MVTLIYNLQGIKCTSIHNELVHCIFIPLLKLCNGVK